MYETLPQDEKNKKFILYGAAALGKIVFQTLTGAGFQVVGFIDRRADEIGTLDGLPVWRLDSVPEQILRDSDIVVFISVKDVFDHTQIANQLMEQGFRFIIYKPRSVLEGTASDEKALVSDLYEKVLRGEWSGQESVPPMESLETYQFADMFLVERCGNTVRARIPAEYIFTNHYPAQASKWSDISLYMFFTHLNLFDWFAGKNTDGYLSYVREYCEYNASKLGVKTSERWRQNVLQNRSGVYEQMSINLETYPDFFIKNAPEAVWNKRGYFNLLGGKHRTSFLLSRGFRLIPLQISYEDYTSYLNYTAAHKLVCYFEGRSLDALPFPIMHPMFYRYANHGATAYHTILMKVMRRLSEKLYTETGASDGGRLTVVDLMGDSGTLSRYFMRIGSQVYRGHGDELTEILDQLMHVEGKARPMDHMPDGQRIDLLLLDIDQYPEADFTSHEIGAMVVSSRETSNLRQLSPMFQIEELVNCSRLEGNQKFCYCWQK